jgi:hypothetical protein
VSNDPNAAQKYNKVYHIKVSTITDWVNNGGAVPAEIANWPAHGNTAMGEANYLAPFVDVNADGRYDPNDGDYPDIKGDEALLAIFNDVNGRTAGSGLGVEVLFMVYGFSTGDIQDSIVYTEYTITQRRGTPNAHCYLSLFTDFETGDIHASNVINDALFAYGPSPTNPNYASAGIRIIEGPEADPFDGQDNDKDGCVDGVRQSNGNCLAEDPANDIVEHFTTSGAMYFDENTTIAAMAAPQTDVDYRNLMQNKWLNDSVLKLEAPNGFLSTANGDGFTSGNTWPFTNYFFPGMSFDTLGTSFGVPSATNWFQNPNQSTGIKTLTCAGPFSINGVGASFTNTAAISWITGNAVNYGYGKMDTILGRLDEAYAQVPVRYVRLEEVYRTERNFQVYYRAAKNQWHVENRETSPLHFKVFSMNGSLLHTFEVAGTHTYELAANGLPAGAYLLVNTETGRAEKITF